MEEKDFKKCKRILEKERNLTDDRRIEILFNECKHPKWNNTNNLFLTLLKEIEVRLEAYEPSVKEAENVGVRRLKDGASDTLPLQIREYLKYRIQTCSDILSFINQLKKMNKKLSNLSDIDRKEVKRILEEEAEKEEDRKIEQEIKKNEL